MRKHVSMVSMVTLWVAFGGSTAMAGLIPDPTCILEARQDLLACRAECVNDFRNEKFVCLNVEPGCGRECLGRRESCIEVATAPLDQCNDGCRSTLQAAKAACSQTCGEDASCLDTCVDQAQVDAFVCRDNCRESFRASGGRADVEACRQRFRACVQDCPPAH